MTSLFDDLETLRRSMVSGRTTRSFSLLWYEFIHVLLALLLSYVQCLFEPRVIEFEQKRAGMRFLMRAPDMAEEMVEQGADKFSERYVSPLVAVAMQIAVTHSDPLWVAVCRLRR